MDNCGTEAEMLRFFVYQYVEYLKFLDYILEIIPEPDFVEVVGRMGGDTITYRVYDNGDMYER